MNRSPWKKLFTMYQSGCLGTGQGVLWVWNCHRCFPWPPFAFGDFWSDSPHPSLRAP